MVEALVQMAGHVRRPGTVIKYAFNALRVILNLTFYDDKDDISV